MSRETEEYPDTEISDSTENEQIITAHSNRDEPSKHSIQRNKPDTKEFILHNFIYIKFKIRPRNLCARNHTRGFHW